MGKIPRVSGNQLIKYLVNKKGFQISHRKGSHVSLQHNNKHKFTSIPSKSDELGNADYIQSSSSPFAQPTTSTSSDTFTMDYIKSK